MRVVLVHNIIPPYRVPLFTAIARDPRVDFRVLFMARTEANRAWKVPDNLDFPHEFLPGRHFVVKNGAHTMHWNPGVVGALARHDPDAVVLVGWDSPTTYLAAAFAHRGRRRRVVLWCESNAIGKPDDEGIRAWPKRWMVRRADCALVPGRRAQEYVERLARPGLPFEIFPNVVDASRFHFDPERRAALRAAGRARLGLAGTVILFVGQMIERKGFPELLAAWDRAEFRSPVTLLLVGSGPLEARAAEAAARATPTRRVVALPFQQIDAVPELYASSDLFDSVGVYSLDAPAGSAILGDIVSDLLQRAGLDVANIDMSDLTQEVRGFVVASQMTVHNAIDLLRQAFFFDIGEWDGKIWGINRGHDAIATIPDGDLGAHEPGSQPPELLAVETVDPLELPQTVFVKFYDVDKDYQPGNVHWSRTTTKSQAQVTLDLPIVFRGGEALAVCQWQMHFAWLERDRFKFVTTRKWCALVKTNVVVVRGVNVRITNKIEQPNGLFLFEGVRAFGGPFTPYEEVPGAITAPPPSGQPPQSPPQGNVQTELVLLDIPWRPPEGNLYGFTAAMGRGGGAGNWGGATLYKSLDGGVTYTAVASTGVPNIIGHATDALDDYTGILDDVDEVSSVEIVLHDTDLQLFSCTDEGLTNGANLCVLKSGAGWELLQYRDALLTAPGTYTLTGFLRGKHGSVAFIATHVDGDIFVLLPATNVDAPESELNISLKYKAVTFGTALIDATPQDFINTGLGAAWGVEALPPYTGGGGGGVPPPTGGPGTCRVDYVLNECGNWILNGSSSGSALIVISIAYSASITVDLTTYAAYPFVVVNVGTMTGNITFDLTNGFDGQVIRVRLKQDGTGGRTFIAGANLRDSANTPFPALSATAGTLDRLGFEWHDADGKADLVAINKGYT